MKKLVTILLCVSSLNLYSQNIELFGGVNNTIFHDNRDDGGHFQSTYKSDPTYSFGIAIDNIIMGIMDSAIFRFTLQFDKYSGNIEARDGGQGGSYSIAANINKSLLSFGFFPISFRIFKKIDFNFGFQLSKLVSESFIGTSSSSGHGVYNSYDLQEKHKKFSSSTYFGPIVRLAYDFHIYKSIIISPQYSFYYGMTNEFLEFPAETKSMRHFIGIGIKKNLKNT